MATKTFSSRTDEANLAFADALTRQEFGMSFGQYCGSVLIEALRQGVKLPEPPAIRPENPKLAAVARIKAIAKKPHTEEVGHLTDEQIKDLLASRYE